MSRINTEKRNFIKSALTFGCGAVAATTLPKSFAKIQPMTLKMVTAWPKNFPGLGTGANYLASQIENLSEGKIKVKVYGAGEIVPAYEVFDTVGRGTVQLGHSVSYYWKGKMKAAQFLAGIPFGMSTQEMNAWLYEGDGIKLWHETYAPHGNIAFPAGNTGVQMGGWFKKKINSIKDLEGLRMRIPGIGGEILKAAGGTPVNIPGGEIFTALQAGTIDAVEWVGPYNDLAFGLNRAAGFAYYPGWHEPGTVLECLVNKKFYNELPSSVQNVIQIACMATQLKMMSEFTYKNAQALLTLKTKTKTQILPFPKEVIQHLKQIADQVIPKLANEDKQAKKVYLNYKQFQNLVSPYQEISEAAYLDTRDAL